MMKKNLNTSAYGKGKKPASNSKIKIYNESLSWGKNIYIGKNKKKNLVTPIEKKINRHAIDWSKEKKNTVNAAKLQGQKSAQY